MSDNTSHNQGFTIVELLISISILGIIAVSLLAIITNYLVIITRNNITVDMTLDSQNLLRSTSEELRYGAGVRTSSTITDPNGPSGGWSTSNTNFVIIIASPAVDADRNYITNPLTGYPYNNELVYFRQGNILYKRSLAHPDATDNRLKTSCPKSIASESCPADTQLLEYVDDMVFTLYDQDDATTNDPLLARSVEIELITSRETFGEPLELSNNIRVTLRNRF